MRVELVPCVKAYPATRARGAESVCVAAIRKELLEPPTWVRLFPVPFRDLAAEQRFRKWEPITLEAAPHPSDHRPETLRPNVDSLQPAGAQLGRLAQVELVEGLPLTSTCALISDQSAGGATLGRIRPTVQDFVWERRDPREVMAAQRAADEAAAQEKLFGPRRAPLEVVPFLFRYRYRCGEPACGGHEQSNIDWELLQTFRKWRGMYGEASCLVRLRERWLEDLCGDDRSTQFFVGNMHQHPASFLVLGVFSPKRGAH